MRRGYRASRGRSVARAGAIRSAPGARIYAESMCIQCHRFADSGGSNAGLLDLLAYLERGG
jgi:mono/diheme cytochrome c family protein